MGRKKQRKKQNIRQNTRQNIRQNTRQNTRQNEVENKVKNQVDENNEKKINKGNVVLFSIYTIICLVLVIYIGIGLWNKVVGKHIEKVTVVEGATAYEGKTARTYKNPSVSYEGRIYHLRGENGNIYEMKMEQYMGARLIIGEMVHVFVPNNPEKENVSATLSRVIACLAGLCLSLFGLRWSVYLVLDGLGITINTNSNKITRLLFDSELFFGIEFLTFLFSLILFGIFMDMVDTFICKMYL